MEQKTTREIGGALAKPFAPEDVEWRIQVTTKDKSKGLAVPYLTNRAIQNRLDEVVGPENWCNEYRPWHNEGNHFAQICGISIHFPERGWVTKWDGAADSDIEAVKGGLSDSMKRAAVHWGIGRYLYALDTPDWIPIEPRGNSFAIPNQERMKLDNRYMGQIQKMGMAVPTTKAMPQNKVSNFPPVPQYDFVVTKLQVQEGMRGKSTLVELTDRSNGKLNAYYNGIMENVAQGTWLAKVKYSTKTQNAVVFHVLEQYEIIPQTAKNVA